MTVRLLITGSRSWDREDLILDELTKFADWATRRGQSVSLLSGTAAGADRMCERVGKRLGFNIERFPADWNAHGKRAGFVRNQEMVNTGPDFCLAFIKSGSRGASMTARIAQESGIVTRVVEID